MQSLQKIEIVFFEALWKQMAQTLIVFLTIYG